jgi:dihydroflavonol-4-reductase
LRDPAVRQIVPELGKYEHATSVEAQRMLGWSPRSNEDALIATAESPLRPGLARSG